MLPRLGDVDALPSQSRLTVKSVKLSNVSMKGILFENLAVSMKQPQPPAFAVANRQTGTRAPFAI